MTAMRAKDRCGSFLRPGRTAERSGNRRNRSISAYSGHFDVKELGIKDCVLIDPCMGSGHILVYMFDVLEQIYQAYGYSARDAARMIIENNLYGLDIDDRCSQLAYFAVMMKARQYDRRILTYGLRPNILAIVESDGLEAEDFSRFGKASATARQIYNAFIDAKIYGSAIKIDCSLARLEELEKAVDEMEVMSDYGSLFAQSECDRITGIIHPILIQARILIQKYHIVVTNPPYMGAGNMDSKLSNFVKKNYPDTKSDLSTVFMEKTISMLSLDGMMAMINIPVWMFISSYEKLRKSILNENTIMTMVHPGRGVFGSDFGTTSFVISRKKINRFNASYARLFTEQVEVKSNEIRKQQFLEKKGRYNSIQNNFLSIPGSPIAYWAKNNDYKAFAENPSLGSFVSAVKGLDTCDNDRFTRTWYEPSIESIGFKATKTDVPLGYRWFPYCKGGDFRRWYGNYNYVVDWENNGEVLRNLRDDKGKIKSRPQNIRFYFNPGLTWSSITSGKLSMRYMTYSIFGGGGSGMFSASNILFIQGLLNSVVAAHFLDMLNPTLNILVGDMLNIPYCLKRTTPVINTVNDCISISKSDWDSFETSWDFKSHPLVPLAMERSEQLSAGMYSEARTRSVSLISDRYARWEKECLDRFNSLKANEEELNRIFIDIYGLQDELTPEVEDKDVTVRKADLSREIRSLISYAVGCMFGRYSLDYAGLAYAGGEWDSSRYSTYIPDRDNVIPICDDDYFEDDIVARFVDFIRVAYGEETLEENLQFIANELGGTGTARDKIRQYFLGSFFADHCATYQVTGSGKRPIYWLFSSGKKNGFKALIYMHRYQPDTIARMRTDYVHQLQAKYRTVVEEIEGRIEGARGSEAAALKKRLAKVKDQAEELRVYEEKIHHLADQMISIDLDDGFKHNYPLFKDVVEKVK